MTTLTRIADYLVEKAKPPVAQTLVVVGSTIERDMLRMHRYSDVIVLWDLTNAGKRGRKVRRLSVVVSFRAGLNREETLDLAARSIENLNSFDDARLELEESDDLVLEAREDRGVDIVPAGFQTIKLETSRVGIEAGYRNFVITNLTDKHNRPTCISTDAVKTVPKFHCWVRENLDRLPAMSYQEILTEMSALGIQYHDYCAED